MDAASTSLFAVKVGDVSGFANADPHQQPSFRTAPEFMDALASRKAAL